VADGLRYGCDVWVRLKPDTTNAFGRAKAGHYRCAGRA